MDQASIQLVRGQLQVDVAPTAVYYEVQLVLSKRYPTSGLVPETAKALGEKMPPQDLGLVLEYHCSFPAQEL